MKRTLSLLAAVLLGCSSNVSRPAAPRATATVTIDAAAPEKPVEVKGDAWSLTFPPEWNVDTTGHVDRSAEGDLKQVLAASTKAPIGRSRIYVELRTAPWKGPEAAFALLLPVFMTQDLANAVVLKAASTEIDGHPASFAILDIQDGFGLGMLVVASGDTGYILTCGGDYLADGAGLSRTCNGVMQSLHVK